MELSEWVSNSQGIRVAAYTKSEGAHQLVDGFRGRVALQNADSIAALEEFLLNLSLITVPEVLIIEIDDAVNCFAMVERIQHNMLLKGLIIILLTNNLDYLEKAKNSKVHDCYLAPYNSEDILNRVTFLVKFKLIKPSLIELSENVNLEYKVPVIKRIFDVVFSGMLILLLSPLFIIVAILIKLESRGPVVYRSKRVGTGYRTFDFYKFRSMRQDADKILASLKDHNQYSSENGDNKTTFIKLKNDPRITRVGRFIRRTSIDELPQLFNILKGDMSAVGNRPLPLYEAEQLTSNEWSWRFLAPAGLTGLWQISRRGKEDMSERERKKLDNFYAQKYSIWFDLKILLRTLPAAYQKENV